MKRIGLAMAILVFGFAASANAAASQKYTYQFRGLGAYGSAYTYDNCGYSAVYFGANQNTTHTDAGGKPVTSDSGHVYWDRFDWCSYTCARDIDHARQEPDRIGH